MANKALKILYLSAHEVLERDELQIFGELGWRYLSLGAFYSPYEQQGNLKRPQLPPEWSLFDDLKGDYDRYYLKKSQVDKFDVIIVMHHPEKEQPWITNNWQRIRHKKVIYRSIGQSSRLTEKALAPLKKEGLLIVRYSSKEKEIPWYCGEDAMIRFYKDPEEFKDWNGEKKQVITVAQSMSDRRSACNFDAFLATTEPFERRLFGSGNENTGLIGGELGYEALKKEYRDSRAYLAANTQPASYVMNFIEAWMTGIPVVAFGPRHCNRDYPEQKTYEVHELIENGKTGFWSDDIPTLQKYIRQLLEDDELAKKISEAGRKKAIELFSKEKIKNEWKEFLDKITISP